MALTFNHLSWLSSRGKWQQSKVSTNSSSNPTRETGLWELDTLAYPLANGTNITSSSRKVKRNCSREEHKLDKEDDVVFVPHDGGCISGSDSDDSDWSIGWLEPHGPEFLSDDDNDDESNNSFAVLVPCYGRGVHNTSEIPQINILSSTRNFSDALSAESKKYMEQWLTSLHNN